MLYKLHPYRNAFTILDDGGYRVYRSCHDTIRTSYRIRPPRQMGSCCEYDVSLCMRASDNITLVNRLRAPAFIEWGKGLAI